MAPPISLFDQAYAWWPTTIERQMLSTDDGYLAISANLGCLHRPKTCAT
jgi:hypothetical protein